jgi:hypothetical protein
MALPRSALLEDSLMALPRSALLEDSSMALPRSALLEDASLNIKTSVRPCWARNEKAYVMSAFSYC